jgi:threonine synthase
MRYVSTRDPDRRVPLATALTDGLAPDGGLYVPERLPTLPPGAFDDLDVEAPDALPAVAARTLRPFVAGDDALAGALGDLCADTLAFPVPLRDLTERTGGGERHTAVLELFHGPTAAFKDVGARFLAGAFSHLNRDADRPLTILVATSGDTGAAVAAAFHHKPGVEVVVLYPKGKVSPRQEKQLTGWDGNVQTVAVEGVFDDCQRLVKAAFADDGWRRAKRLSSANSINIGRLLPQMTYYAAASLRYRQRHGARPAVIVPSGNLGNVLAALYARAVGLPLGEIVLATNANRPVTRFLATGDWAPMPTVETLATAMDVGNPSNMERLRHHWPTPEAVRAAVTAERVPDDAIRRRLREGPARWGEVWDPHTATAVEVRARRAGWPHAVLVATAHPAKFDHVVEPLVGRPVPVPDALAAVMARSRPAPSIPPSLDALRDVVG